MIGVYFFHTRAYCHGELLAGGGNLYITSVLGPFYVNAFFVVSGYLFFRKWMNKPSGSAPTSLDYKNLLFRLVIPTLLFSSIIYLPKLFFHSREFYLTQYCRDVFGGISYWFTSAMAVSQLLLLLLLNVGVRQMKYFIALSVLLVLLLPAVKDCCPSPVPWYWKTGLASIPLMVMGGLIYKFRAQIANHNKALSALIVISYLLIVSYEFYGGNAHYALMSVTFNGEGILVTLVGIAFIFVISKYIIPKLYLLQFIGSNSIVFYFLSGIIPATLSSLPFINYLGHGVIATLFLSLVSISIGIALTAYIIRYLPFLTDLRKLTDEKSPE